MRNDWTIRDDWADNEELFRGRAEWYEKQCEIKDKKIFELEGKIRELEARQR